MATPPRILVCVAALALLATVCSAMEDDAGKLDSGATAGSTILDASVTEGIDTTEEPEVERTYQVPDYYTCFPSQGQNFSSPSVEDRFQQAYGSAERGSKRMPLLMMAMEREQLTKGRIHVADAMNIAKLTNRSFVLSRVGESRVALDQPLPMCTYFDTQLMGQFVDWVDYKVVAPMLPKEWQPIVSGSAASPVGTPLSVFSVIFQKAYQPCFPQLWKKQLTQNEMLTQWAKDVLHPLFDHMFDADTVFCAHENDWRVLGRLFADPRYVSADLVVFFNTADWIFSDEKGILEASAHLTFAPHLVKAASSLVESQLGQEVEVPAGGEEESAMFQAPYVAIQWRTEYAALMQTSVEDTVPGTLRCAQSLIEFTSARLKSQGQRLPFLAADLDNKGHSASKSFYNEPLVIQQAAQAAIKAVYKELDAFSWQIFDPHFKKIDTGLQGILDKLVAMGASLFVFAPPECGGKDSSYTRSILLSRHNMGRKSQCWTCEDSEEIPKGWLRPW